MKLTLAAIPTAALKGAHMKTQPDTIGEIVDSSRLRRVETAGMTKGTGTGTCSLCGANFAFSPGKHGQRFCSPYCRRKAWMQQKAPLHGIAELRKKIGELERRIGALESK